jgi:hypothetical protein
MKILSTIDEENLGNFSFRIPINKIEAPRLKHEQEFNKLFRGVYKNIFFGGQKLLCQINSLFRRVNFFPPNFPFPKYKRKFWREKFTLQMNEVLFDILFLRVQKEIFCLQKFYLQKSDKKQMENLGQGRPTCGTEIF